MTIVFVLLASIFKAVMDKLQFHFDNSIFSNFNNQFWNPKVSWKNKWKNGDKSQGERFFGSSTFFVSFTDAWHLFQKFFLISIFLAVVFYETIFGFWFDFFFFYLIFVVNFELFFSLTLNKKI